MLTTTGDRAMLISAAYAKENGIIDEALYRLSGARITVKWLPIANAVQF